MILAVVVAQNPAEFDCRTCAARHCDDSRPAAIERWVVDGVIASRTCLLPMVTAQSRFLLGLYRHYRAGLLAVAGGVLEQPQYYLTAMEILDEAIRVHGKHD